MAKKPNSRNQSSKNSRRRTHNKQVKQPEEVLGEEVLEQEEVEIKAQSEQEEVLEQEEVEIKAQSEQEEVLEQEEAEIEAQSDQEEVLEQEEAEIEAQSGQKEVLEQEEAEIEAQSDREEVLEQKEAEIKAQNGQEKVLAEMEEEREEVEVVEALVPQQLSEGQEELLDGGEMQKHPRVTYESLRSSATLITGFPGFLTRNLFLRLLREQAEQRVTFYLLVESRHHALAERRLNALLAKVPNFNGAVHLIDGDISQPNLGLDEGVFKKITREVEVVWHLAAIYDLSVAETVAYAVNVLGTFHVLDFCEKCKSFQRLNYISTCYVSGTRKGLILEDELECGQEHNNHYESTKFWAEVEVQRRQDVVPSVIFRPAIVVGDSNDGTTDKYDGPYYLFKLFEQLPAWLPIPNVCSNGAEVNLVPVNFVCDAMAYLGLDPKASGVYQLADHRPLEVPDIIEELAMLFGVHLLPEIVPAKALTTAVGVPFLEKLVKTYTGIPAEVVDYFSHMGRYDTLRTRSALEASGIVCPSLKSYLPILLDYMSDHPDKEFLDGRK